MDTAASISFRSWPSRRFLASSSRRLHLNTVFPHSIHLQDCLPHRTSKISLAVTGQSPAITSDYLQESTSFSSIIKNHSSENENIAQNKSSEDSKNEQMNESEMIKVCDKLIEIFLVDKPKASDWRKMLAYSKTWSEKRTHFYNRCQERANNESDPSMKVKFLKLSRKLKEVDDDVKGHNELIEAIKNNRDEINNIINKRRKDFTNEFFIHFGDVADSYYQNPEIRQDMIKMGNACLAAVKIYDNSKGNIKDIKEPELKFNDLINFNSANLDINSRKIDDLVKRNNINSSHNMMINNAWSEAKETTLVKDEAKEMMYDMYMKGLGSLEKMVPKEVRILKYILTLKDPKEVLAALNDAFTPSVEYETQDHDYLWTTPSKLHTLTKTIVDAFNAKMRNLVTREARDLVQPKLIGRLEELRKIIEHNFL